jgi:tetratricopeptide (TPR) repeat protein/cold shock CspA family protein
VSDATSQPTAEPATVNTATLLEQAAKLADGLQWSDAADLLAGSDATDVLARRSFYLSRAKRYDEALELLAELRKREPKMVRWPYMTGYQYYERQLYAEALPWYEAALALDPDHLSSNYRLAHTYHQLGREREAVTAAGRVLRLWHAASNEVKERERRKLANASYLLGRDLMNRGDHRNALELLKQAVTNDDGDHNKHYRFGKALRHTGDSAAAVVSLRRALRLKPHTTYAEVELAAALADSGDNAEAESLLTRIAAHCRGWNAYKAGQLAIRLGRQQLAVELLERAGADRLTRKEPRVQEALATARAAVSQGIAKRERGQADASATVASERGEGVVDVVRPERGFGFLVDAQGTRRHFRVRGGRRVAVGDRVSFLPVSAEKGPAARELKPL